MTVGGENLALLPAGLTDLLPPEAEHEGQMLTRLVDMFTARGYERVKPPLVEFEDSLLGRGMVGQTLAEQAFRVMDPISQRMLGVRADMTLQIARIATTRLAKAPRPLRLCYAGQVLRVRGSQLRPERQFTQAGVELIGADVVGADIEVVLLAVEALRAAGVKAPSVDLNSPALVAGLLASLDIAPAAVDPLRSALDHKDIAAVRALVGDAGDLFAALLDAVGPAKAALAALSKLRLPAAAAAEASRLATVVAGIGAAAPDVPITVDPVECRGFEYHTGVSFTLYAIGGRGELGRGGRFVTVGGEPSTGCTLFLDSVLRAVARPPPRARLFVPLGTEPEAVRRMRADGWVTVAGLEATVEPRAEARRLNCSHALIEGRGEAVAASGDADE